MSNTSYKQLTYSLCSVIQSYGSKGKDVLTVYCDVGFSGGPVRHWNLRTGRHHRPQTIVVHVVMKHLDFREIVISNDV